MTTMASVTITFLAQEIRETKLARVEENIGAAAIDLTPDDLCEIDGAASKISVQGARYPKELERLTYR